jgi:diguanylate cyclase (GGDEF)-like protein
MFEPRPPPDSTEPDLQGGGLAAERPEAPASILAEAWFDRDPLPRIIISTSGQPFCVVAANGAAAQLFADGAMSPGTPLADLVGEDSALLGLVSAASETPATVELVTGEMEEPKFFLATVAAIAPGLVAASFVDVTERALYIDALKGRNEELDNTNKHLEAQALEMAALAASLESAREILNEEVQRRMQLEGQLRGLVETDALSGTASRRHFLDCLEQELVRAHRFGRLTSLVMLDVDRFKLINDTYGHAAGDMVIEMVGLCCRENIRIGIDIAGRLGGEEFAILLPETDLTGALAAAERLRRRLCSIELAVGDSRIAFTASFGVATTGSEFGELSAKDLLREADAALYEAKHSGRDRVIGVSRPASRVA